MKPSKFDHDTALNVCWNFSDYRPEFDAKAAYQTGTPDCAVADAIMCLSYTAAMYSCNAESYYTREQFNDAIVIVVAATNGHIRTPRSPVAHVKGPAQTPPTPNSRTQTRRITATERWSRCATDPQFKALCESYGLTTQGPQAP